MIFQYFTRTIGLTVCAMFLTVAATYGQAPNVRPKAAPKGAAKAEAPLAPSGPDVAVLGRVAFKGQAPVFKPIAMDSEPSCIGYCTFPTHRSAGIRSPCARPAWLFARVARTSSSPRLRP